MVTFGNCEYPFIEFDRYPFDTAKIMVQYVPIPIMGVVFAGMGTG